MQRSTRLTMLKIALVVFGAILAFGLYPLMHFYWPSGFRWTPNQSEYEEMILSIYIIMGLFMIFCARNPMKHVSFIWFVIVSSVAHGGVMAYQAIQDSSEHGHLAGDVPALFLIAIVLAVLLPKKN